MLLHQALQRDLLGPVALVVNRGAVGRPVGLPTDALHALLPPCGELLSAPSWSVAAHREPPSLLLGRSARAWIAAPWYTMLPCMRG